LYSCFWCHVYFCFDSSFFETRTLVKRNLQSLLLGCQTACCFLGIPTDVIGVRERRQTSVGVSTENNSPNNCTRRCISKALLLINARIDTVRQCRLIIMTETARLYRLAHTNTQDILVRGRSTCLQSISGHPVRPWPLIRWRCRPFLMPTDFFDAALPRLSSLLSFSLLPFILTTTSWLSAPRNPRRIFIIFISVRSLRRDASALCQSN